MTTDRKLRVLFFDVFGTCVAQFTSVGNELWEAAQEALQRDLTIDGEIRSKAAKMLKKQWFEFGREWFNGDRKFVNDSIEKYGNVDWRAVDKHRIDLLPRLLSCRGLISIREDGKLEEGSLWNEAQLKHLGLVWHRLKPWPDTCHGLHLLNKHFSTTTLSNTYNDVIKDLVAYSNIPFMNIYTADMWQSFKPDPKVYLGAAEKLGVKPEECGLVAAHLYDLKAAKDCGFYTIYVERALEETHPELRGENIPDVWIEEHENGFVTVAKRLGIHVE